MIRAAFDKCLACSSRPTAGSSRFRGWPVASWTASSRARDMDQESTSQSPESPVPPCILLDRLEEIRLPEIRPEFLEEDDFRIADLP